MRSGGTLVVALAAWGLGAPADILVGTNADRFTGKVVRETPEVVVFESELAGRLTILRDGRAQQQSRGSDRA